MSSLDTGKADCPFTGHGELVNIKFFRGTRDDVIAGAEIKGQAHRANMQLLMGTADVSSTAPKSAHPSIDVAKFVASL
jgi:hypothetical protein